MAQPDLALQFVQDPENIEIGTLIDITDDYGSGAVEARGDAANFPLWSKTDQNGNRTYEVVQPVNALSTMNWSVGTPEDGWYEGMIVRVQPYNNATNYVAQQQSGGTITVYPSIVYYLGNAYKAIDDTVGNLPTDTDFWELIPLNQIYMLLGNTNIQQVITNFYVRTRSDNCVSSKFKKLYDLGGACDARNERLRSVCYYLAGLIMSADAQFAQGNPEEMEKIIRQVRDTCGSTT
jgi:hypothetical protein